MITLYTKFSVPTLFPGANALILLLVLWAFRAVATFGRGGGNCSGLSASGVLPMRNGMFMLVLSSSSLWDSPGGHFYMFANTFLCCSFSPLVCSSTLYPNLLQVVPFTCVRYYFFDVFPTPKPSFVQFHTCISLTDPG